MYRKSTAPGDQQSYATDLTDTQWDLVESPLPTFAILGRHRRLAKYFEALAETGETLIHMAMVHILVKRLAPSS